MTFAFAENNSSTKAVGRKKLSKINATLSRIYLKTKLKRRSMNC